MFDSVGNRWFTLRTKYEHAKRRGTGIEQGELELVAINEQRGMRHFDIAERDRNRVTVVGTTMPVANLSLSASVAAGRDNFLNTLFGLLDNKHRVYSFGADATPTEQLSFGLSYTYEDYRALSRSRQASNAAQQADVTRNWSTDGHDRVHSVTASVDVAKIKDKVDLRLSYDLSHARANYVYGVGPIVDRTLPEETDVLPGSLPPLTPTGVISQLPPPFSETQRGSVDLTYALTERLGVGMSFWHDRYRVADFTLSGQADPRIDRGNALLLGYFYEPYTAKTFWARIIYRW